MVEQVLWEDGQTKPSSIDPGKYRVYCKLPSIPLLKVWYELTYKPLYHALIFGSDQKAVIKVPLDDNGIKFKDVTVWEPSIIDNQFVFDFEFKDDPPWGLLSVIALIVVGLAIGTIFISKVTKLVEVTGGGDILKGIGDALKNAAQGGWLTPVLLIGAVVALVLLLPKLIGSGKKALADLK